MALAAKPAQDGTDHHRCGCCGRQLPAGKVAELGQTPGVYICAGCALWAARRAGMLYALRRFRLRGLVRLALRAQAGQPKRPQLRAVIPILPSTDLDRTAAFYRLLGFIELKRFDGYLLLHSAGVELHFASPGIEPPGNCVLHVPDAGALWTHLTDQGVTGVGGITNADHGLREFTITDPDGNKMRVGSQTGAR